MELQQSTTDKNASYISKFVVVEGKVHVTKPRGCQNNALPIS